MIRIPIVSEWNGKGVEQAIKKFQSLQTTSEKAQFAISKAAVPAAAALGGLAAVAVSSAKAAAEDAAAQTALANQIRRSTGATTQAIAANEGFLSKLSMQAAVADDDLRPALQSLVVGTKDLGTAQTLLSTALDLSAATGRDLSATSQALSRGFNGNMRALQSLSPEVKKMVKDGASFDQVLAALQRNFAGASKEAANTAQGGFKKMSIAIGEAKESLGTALLPIVQKFSTVIANMAVWVQNNTGLFIAFGTAIGIFAGTIVAAQVALTAWKAISAITTAVNMALATSFTAVQIATGVGIATAILGAATFMKLKDTFKATKVAADDLTASTDNMISSQQELNKYVGPVVSRDYVTFKNTLYDIGKAEEARKTATDKAHAAAQKAHQKFVDNIKAAKQALTDYANGIASTVSGYVSLTGAVNDANDREQKYNDALAERRDAYADLKKLTDSQTASEEQLASAKERVASAETSVTAAAGNRRTYTQQFQEQIAKAKEFAGKLKQLAAMGLSRAGLAQLMDLGPVAGVQVASDLISGVNGFTVAGLNADLAAVESAGLDVGNQMVADDRAILGKAGSSKATQNVVINVNGGDPQAVVNALRAYMFQNGSVPIRVSG